MIDILIFIIFIIIILLMSLFIVCSCIVSNKLEEKEENDRGRIQDKM